MKCTNCAREIEKGTGIMYVYRTGDISYYCSNKCMNNQLFLKRRTNRKLVVQPSKSTREKIKTAATAVKK